MQQLNDKNYMVGVLKWVKAHLLSNLWLIGLAFGLIGIYIVNGWLQYFFLALGSGCFLFDRLRDYMKDIKSDE